MTRVGSAGVQILTDDGRGDRMAGIVTDEVAVDRLVIYRVHMTPP